MQRVDDFGVSILRRFADAIDPSGDWFDTVEGQVVEHERNRVEFFRARIEVDPWAVGLSLTVTRSQGAEPAPSLPEITPLVIETLHSWKHAGDPGLELAGMLALLVDPEARFTIAASNEVRLEGEIERFEWTLELLGRTVNLVMEFEDPIYHAVAQFRQSLLGGE